MSEIKNIRGTSVGEKDGKLYYFKDGKGVPAVDEKGGGSDVEANPSAEATESLEKIQIGNTVYGIEGGGSGESNRGVSSEPLMIDWNYGPDVYEELVQASFNQEPVIIQDYDTAKNLPLSQTICYIEVSDDEAETLLFYDWYGDHLVAYMSPTNDYMVERALITKSNADNVTLILEKNIDEEDGGETVYNIVDVIGNGVTLSSSMDEYQDIAQKLLMFNMNIDIIVASGELEETFNQFSGVLLQGRVFTGYNNFFELYTEEVEVPASLPDEEPGTLLQIKVDTTNGTEPNISSSPSSNEMYNMYINLGYDNEATFSIGILQGEFESFFNEVGGTDDHSAKVNFIVNRNRTGGAQRYTLCSGVGTITITQNNLRDGNFHADITTPWGSSSGIIFSEEEPPEDGPWYGSGRVIRFRGNFHFPEESLLDYARIIGEANYSGVRNEPAQYEISLCQVDYQVLQNMFASTELAHRYMGTGILSLYDETSQTMISQTFNATNCDFSSLTSGPYTGKIYINIEYHEDE